ncbi:MAG: AcrB/AcrD/AcrF family protein [Microcystis aeruginosa Ma_MB_S_20031200_S102]|uniref:AcrB/AcrD/AcrF family protein n=1 Tax=Microcystis aeruginosa Ma_MB_S_20031200_S102 TaxID=2486254 RepID=A0A552F8S6_MICAE|nr:MAG: AcrB/AcrD/AcrF family protein [Microcystis aeruginosa Ma_MB_S_20031200_S102D]TRU43097.1 MAG: AcrB/AcrD/AcrF family protein [Microcystis aeruginosa Ma_MB_S_20031200_S102]
MLENISLSGLSIRRHIGVLMLTIAVIIIGLFFLNRLQVDLLPSITYPRISLRMNVPGVSPEVILEEVTKPLEEGMSATEGVVQVYSETREGRMRVDLFFQPGGDLNVALNEATESFNRVRQNLPDIIEEPRLNKFEPSRLPVYEFALVSDTLPLKDLRLFADEELGRELGFVEGVAVVDVIGGVREEIQVNIDLQRLQSLGVGLNQVLDTLKRRNQEISGGRLEGETGEPLTRAVGKFKNVADIQDLALTDSNNPEEKIYLRDVARVIDGTEEQRIFVTLNGKNAVRVSIQKQPNANTIAVVEGVKKRIAELKKSGLMTGGMQVVTTTDESVFIQNAVNNVVSSGLAGTILAGLTVFVFLGSLRQTFIIILAIPLSTLVAIICMKLFGLSINVFSLGGLALGVGIVVDNSIVMLENIALKVNQNQNKRDFLEIARNSSQEVESALVASTATNLVSILPFLLLGGFISLLFNEIILTISFAVAASLLCALTVVPMLASRLLNMRVSSGIQRFWLLKVFSQRLEGLTILYSRFLAKIIRYRIAVILLAFLILGGSSFYLWQYIPQEVFSRIQTGQVNVFAQFPPGTNLNTNRQVMGEVEKILLSQPETKYVFTTSGGSLFGTTTNENILRASSTINLKQGTNTEAYIERMSKTLEQLNLVNVRLRLTPGQVRGIILNNSPSVGADVDVMLQGRDGKTLEQAGEEILSLLDEKVPGVRFRPDADPRQLEIQIKPDWTRLNSLGLSTPEVGQTVRTAIQGSIPTQLQRGERLIDIRVQLEPNSRQKISDISQIPIFVNRQEDLKLADIASIEAGKTPAVIQRINQRQVFIIIGSLVKGAKLSDALAGVQSVLNSTPLPDGISILPSAAAISNQEIQGSLGLLAGLSVFLVFVVMAVQYNSLIDPLVIMLTVPLALAGGIFGLYLTKTPINAIVIVGVVLLVGIVVNNGIIMVELANQLRQEFGFTRLQAILKAAPQRLRPILMTTVTTVLGLFPLALGLGEGGEFLQPLGIVVFSGLSLATLLTLFIIPCFYVLFSRK